MLGVIVESTGPPVPLVITSGRSSSWMAAMQPVTSTNRMTLRSSGQGHVPGPLEEARTVERRRLVVDLRDVHHPREHDERGHAERQPHRRDRDRRQRQVHVREERERPDAQRLEQAVDEPAAGLVHETNTIEATTAEMAVGM